MKKRAMFKLLGCTVLAGFATFAALTPARTIYTRANLGLLADIVSDKAVTGSFVMTANKQVASIFLKQADWPGVWRAGAVFLVDIARVTGTNLELSIYSASQDNLPFCRFNPKTEEWAASGQTADDFECHRIKHRAVDGFRWSEMLGQTVINQLT
jgi:hypothetical protein